MTSVVVSDGGGNLVEYVTVVEESQQVSGALSDLMFISTIEDFSNNDVMIIKIICVNFTFTFQMCPVRTAAC